MESPNRIKFHTNEKYKKQIVSLNIVYLEYIIKPKGEKHVKLNP